MQKTFTLKFPVKTSSVITPFDEVRYVLPGNTIGSHITRHVLSKTTHLQLNIPSMNFSSSFIIRGMDQETVENFTNFYNLAASFRACGMSHVLTEVSDKQDKSWLTIDIIVDESVANLLQKTHDSLLKLL